ncbi:MAG: YcxB family protein [Clostridiales bacterium]|nr:YcxB family protein [Clostridiales bacterium]
MIITTTVKETREEMKEFQSLHLKRVLALPCAILLLALSIAFVMIYTHKDKITDYILPIAVFAISVGLFANLFSKRKKVIIGTDKRPQFTYEFDSSGFSGTTGERSFKLAWENVLKVIETKNLFVIYLNNDNGIIIPKRTFKNNYELEYFRKNYLFIRKGKKKIYTNKDNI